MSTAKELFKELGYEKAEKSESVVLYTNRYGDTISFKETKHVVITPVQGCRSLTMTCLFENAIHKQCKELGWFEEEKQEPQKETNLEHYYNDLLKIGWNSGFGVTNGKIKHCNNVDCGKCYIGRLTNEVDCGTNAIKWLASPYKKPVYKLTKFEYDLLNAYKDSGMLKSVSSYSAMHELHEKGYFKDIDISIPIHKILENYEIKGEEKND